MVKAPRHSLLYIDCSLAVMEVHGKKLRDFVIERRQAGASVAAIASELSELSGRTVHRRRLYDWQAKLGISFRTVRTCVELRPVRRVGRPTNAEAQQLDYEPVSTGTEG